MSVEQSIVVYRPVKDDDRYRVGTDGSVWSKCSGKWKRLLIEVGKLGYCRVAIRQRRRLVHRLVLEAFVGPCPKGFECRHYPDPHKNNNSLANLRWGSRKQNAEDRVRDGSQVRGEKMWKAKLTEEKVKSIRDEFDAGENPRLIGAKHGVSRSTAARVGKRQLWKHVP